MWNKFLFVEVLQGRQTASKEKMIVDLYNFFLQGRKGQKGICGAPGPEVRIAAYVFEFISPNNFWTKIENLICDLC